MLFRKCILFFLVFNNSISGFSASTEKFEQPGKGDVHENDHCCKCLAAMPGTPGMPGIPGVHGLRGKNGEKGNSGAQGMKGQRGIKGERGNVGQKGDQGPMGPPGHQGEGHNQHNGISKIAFSSGKSQKLGPVSVDTAILFDVVYFNTGEGFDATTSQFICQKPGVYMFTTHVLGQNQKDAYAWIMLNEKHKVPLHGDGRAGYGTGSQTILMDLKANDKVWVQLSKDSALLNDYSTFSGFLLFESDQDDDE